MNEELRKHLDVLDADPANEAALTGLEDILTGDDEVVKDPDTPKDLEQRRHRLAERGEWEAVCRLLELELLVAGEAGDEAREVALTYSLARTHLDRLHDQREGLRYLEKVLALDANHTEAEGLRDEVLVVRERWQDFVERFAEEAESATEPSLRASLYYRAAEALFRNEPRELERVRDLLTQSLAADPCHPQSLDLLGLILSREGASAAIGELHVAAADASTSREDRLRHLKAAARIFATAGNEERAATLFQEVLEGSPGHPGALAYLADHYDKHEQWDALVGLYEDALKGRPRGEAETAMLLQIGMVHWRRREDLDAAEEYFFRLRKVDPLHRGMLQFYRELCDEKEDWNKLLQILGDAQRAAKDDEDKVALSRETAKVAARLAGNQTKAIDSWKQVLRLDPTNAEARDALRGLYENAEQWNALLDLLKADIEALDEGDVAGKVAVLERMVAIYRDKLSHDPMVINTYNTILRTDPDNRKALDDLASIYETLGRWSDLTRVLERRAELSEDPGQRVSLLTRVARLWVERFNNLNKAVEPLEQILEIAPENADALDQLKAIYEKRRAWKPLFEVLRREADTLDGQERNDRLVEMAKIAAERLDRHDDAVSMLEEVHAADPARAGVLDDLERLTERQRDWEGLARVLERRIPEVDGQDRVQLLVKLGTVYGERLDDPARAAEKWRQLIELQPGHPKAVRVLKEAYVKTGDFAALEDLYASLGDWEGFVEVLSNAADQEERDEVKVELSFRAAAIYVDRIGQPARAQRSFERILAVDESNERAARALVEIYETGAKWPRLLGVLKVLLAYVDPGTEEHIDLLVRLRDLCSERLADRAEAFRWAATAYTAAPEREDLRESLEELAGEANAWGDLLAIYDRRASSTNDDRERLGLLQRVAELSNEVLGHTESALERYRQVLELSPGDRTALDALERIYSASGQFEELLGVLRMRLAAEEEPGRRCALLLEMARVHEEGLDDDAAAADLYHSVLELRPDDNAALSALERMAYGTERWEDLVEILERRRRYAEDEEAAAITFRLADLFAQRLAEPGRAIAELRTILDESVGHPGALDALVPFLDHEELGGEVARVLEVHLEAIDDFPRLARVLGIILEETAEPGERVDLLKRIAGIQQEQLGDADAAMRSLGRALELSPSDRELWERLELLADATDGAGRLAEMLGAAFRSQDIEGESRTALAARLARIYDLRLGDAEGSREYHEHVLAADPAAAASFDALEGLFTASDRWDDLLRLYREQADRVADPDRRRELLLKVCFIHEEVLDQPDEAIAWYVRVLEIQPDDPRANEALQALYAQTGRWRDLADLTVAKLERSDADTGLELRHRLGELHQMHLDDPSTALDYYEEVLAERPTHLRAQEALEGLLSNRDLRQRVAAILEPIYERQGAGPELVRVLEVQLEEVTDPVGKVDLLMRIGNLREKRLGESLEAFFSFARALDSDPAAEAPRHELRRLAEDQGIEGRYCEILERAITAAEDDVALRCELLGEVAALYDTRLADRDRAEDAYRRLLDADPDNPETALPAALALEALYLHAERWEALVEILELRARFAQDPADRRDLLLRVAEIQEAYLDRPSSAISTFAQILEVVPDDLSSLHALERLYERTEGWSELVGVLRRRIELTGAVDEKRELHFRIARLVDERLDNADEAILVYHAVLADLGPDREATRALVRLYERSERWVDLLEALEGDLALAEDSEERASVLCRMGALHRERLDEPGRAVDRYRAVLELAPTHADARAALESLLEDDQVKLEAAGVLAPIYEKEGSWPNLIAILELEAREAMSPSERWEKLRQAADVAEVGLEAPGRAFELLGAALREGAGEPQAGDIVEGLERLAVITGRHSDLVGLYKDVVSDILDGELQLRVMLRVAGTAHRELGDLDLARTYYVKILETFGDHEGAMDALEEIYRATEAHHDLLDIYKRKTSLAEDDGERRRLFKAQAELCEVALGDIPQATSAYEAILDLGEDDEATAALERLYAQAGRHTDLAALLERRLGAVRGEAAVELHCRLGELHRGELGDADTAIDHYRAALAVDPRHGDTVAALEHLMGDAERRGIVAEMLQPIYKSRMDWPKLVEAIEARLDGTPDPVDRKPLLLELGTIFEEQLEDLERAFETYARCFADDVEDAETRDLLSRLAGVLDAWPRLAAVYAKALDDVLADTEGTAELALVLGRVYDERCDDRERARDAYRRVLAFDPDRAEAFVALESLLQRMEAWRELLDLYREAADRALDLGPKKTFLFKLASTYEEQLEDRSAAIDAFREVLDLDERDPRAIAALDRLYYYEERWPDLADLFMRRIEQTDERKARNELRCQLASVYEERLDDLTSAIDGYERVLESAPDNADALAALERLVMNEDVRFRIAKILEPIYELRDEWMKLVVIYDAELEFIADKDERVRLRREIARLHEVRGGDLQIAFGALADAFAEEPGDGEILASLQRLAEQRGSWEELVVALEKGLEATYDMSRKAELLRLVARTQDRRLGDPRAAIDGYRRLLEADETDVEALDALEGLYTLVGDWDGQIETLERKADRASDPSERKDLLHRVGAIFEDMLGDLDKAVDAYQRAYVEDDSDLETISALDRLYEQREQWSELVDVLRRRLEVEEGPDARREVLNRIAVVHDQKLADQFEATQAYQAVLRESPRDPLALEALDRLHSSAQRWPELLDVLRIKAELAEDSLTLVDLQMRIGELLEKELLDLDRAIDTYRAVLAQRPDHDGALVSLERIAMEESHRFVAAEVLEPLLRAVGAYERLGVLKELKLSAIVDPAERVTELWSIAALREEGLGDSAGAFDAYVRALAESPGAPETHANLERLAGQLGAWDRLAAAYLELASQVFDAEQAYDLNARLGHIFEEMLGNNAEAIEAYRRALEAGGDESGPLSALDRLFLREERWQDLAEILEREMGATLDESATNLLEFRLGSLREQHFGDVSGAIAAYRSIVERSPDHDESIEALERLLHDEGAKRDVIDVLDPLYRQRQEQAKLAHLYRVRVELADVPSDRVALLGELAVLQEKELGNAEAALESLSEAFRLDPADPMLLGELERVVGGLGAWPHLSGVIEEVLVLPELDPMVAKELGLRAARLFDERLGDPRRAEDRYRAVLVHEPDNTEVLSALEALLRRAGAPEALVPILVRRADVELDIDEKKRLLHEAAAVARERLGDVATAAECYESLLAADEADPVALDALASIREEEGRWAELAELLSRRAQHSTDPEEGRVLHHRVATLQAGPLERPDKAIDTYRDILDNHPSDADALAALERLLTEGERWLDLQEVLVRRLDFATSDSDRIVVLLKQAALAEHRFESVEDAAMALRSVLDIDPAHAEANEGLERLLAKDERWQDLVDVLEARAQRAGDAGDVEVELRLLVRIGEAWEQKLGDPGAAIEIYEKVLAREPEHTRALGALARLHEEAGDWDRCAEVLERAAASGGPPGDVAEILYRLGRLNHERRDDPGEAERCFWRALDLDPGHGPAAEALKGLLEARGDDSRIAELLERQLAATAASEQRVALLRDIGRIHLERLRDAATAVPFLEQARQLDPGNQDVLVMLVDVYIGAGKLAEAIPLLEGLIQAELDAKRMRSKELALYRHRLGKALEAQGDRAGAKEQYEQAYKIDIGNVDVLANLGMLYFEDDELDKATKVFRGLLLQRAESSVMSKADIYARMGAIHRKQGEEKKALGMYQRGLDTDPGHAECKRMVEELRGS